jgi:hypothetical protein
VNNFLRTTKTDAIIIDFNPFQENREAFRTPQMKVNTRNESRELGINETQSPSTLFSTQEERFAAFVIGTAEMGSRMEDNGIRSAPTLER